MSNTNKLFTIRSTLKVSFVSLFWSRSFSWWLVLWKHNNNIYALNFSNHGDNAFGAFELKNYSFVSIKVLVIFHWKKFKNDANFQSCYLEYFHRCETLCDTTIVVRRKYWIKCNGRKICSTLLIQNILPKCIFFQFFFLMNTISMNTTHAHHSS